MYRIIAGYVAKLPGAIKEGARLYSIHSLRATTATLSLMRASISARSRSSWATGMSLLPRFTTNGGALPKKARPTTYPSKLTFYFGFATPRGAKNPNRNPLKPSFTNLPK
jgi:hypothetical protein